STEEKKALDKAVKLLDALDETRRERVLDCADIWIADLEEADGLDAVLGRALLEPAVVVKDLGVQAWTTLREQARDLGRKRQGATLNDLIGLLRAVPLTLAADAEGYSSARAEQQRLLVSAYRDRVRGRGESLDLRGLGATIPRAPLADIDARVRVVGAKTEGLVDEDVELNGGLAWALRRRGRAVLSGLPGSGKSVALRAAAAQYAARPDWPLPIVVALDRVARLLESMGFDDALLEVAFQEEPLDGRSALRAAAVDAIRTGDAALFLDGLDEVRRARPRVLRGLEDMLVQADPAVELVLSTRDVAYADAHTLGLSDLRLASPDGPDLTVGAILHALAKQRALTAADARGWIRERRQWITDRLDGDPDLRETPLMVILLT
ncbi:MAG: hypothetical protein ACYC0H_17655, partial [Solirubrobacteraceae bacterium]